MWVHIVASDEKLPVKQSRTIHSIEDSEAKVKRETIVIFNVIRASSRINIKGRGFAASHPAWILRWKEGCAWWTWPTPTERHAAGTCTRRHARPVRAAAVSTYRRPDRLRRPLAVSRRLPTNTLCFPPVSPPQVIPFNSIKPMLPNSKNIVAICLESRLHVLK